MFPLEIETLARLLIDECQERRLRIVAAESCTGGLVSAALTAVPGSSDYFVGGFITYTKAMKTELLGVDTDLLERFGAVSKVS